MTPLDHLTAPIAPGTRVLTDSRNAKSWAFDVLNASDWDGAEFYLTGDPLSFIPDLAVNVKVTGRTVRFDAPNLYNVPVIRVEITFVHEDDEDVKVGGWMLAADRS